MATYCLRVGDLFVADRGANDVPQLTPTPSLALTFESSEAAEGFGATLVYPAGTGFPREIWESMHVVTGRCVITKADKYLSATDDEVAWVPDIAHARDFGSHGLAQAYIRRRTKGFRARRSADGRALQGAVIQVVFV